MRLTDLLALSNVPRWSVVDHSRHQSVADHTFRMTVIAIELCSRLHIPIGNSLLIACLFHDGPESRTGDIPNGAKRKLFNPKGSDSEFIDWDPYPNLSDNHQLILWLADKIEGAHFIKRYGIGPHAEEVAWACFDEIRKAPMPEGWLNVVTDLQADMANDAGRKNW